MNAPQKVQALRAITEHIHWHDLAEDVVTITLTRRPDLHPHKVHARAAGAGSAVALLGRWAETLNATRVDAELVFGTLPSRGSFHLSVHGQLPGGVPLEVTVTTERPETAALAAADLSGDVPLADVIAAVAGVEP